MPLEICRICGSNQNPLKHVFSDGNEELVDQIRLCANIHINALDDLPKYVCSVCEQGLAFSYRLRKKGEETEKKLRQELLSPQENEAYCLEEVDEDFLDDRCCDEGWVKSEAEDHLEQEEELLENGEDVEEVLETLPVEVIDESKEWMLHDDFIETMEATEANIDIVKLEDGLIEIVCVNNLPSETNEDEDEVNITTRLVSLKLIRFKQQLSEGAPKRKELDCNACGEVFQTRVELLQHVKEHGDKRFHCDICDKWFNFRYRYVQHRRNHSSEQGAFQCEKCSKTYTLQSNLDRHVRSTHNGEKKYQCFECGASFGRADILKMHIATHTTERNMECDICQKKFKTVQHLHYHKKSHIDKSERAKKPVRLKPKSKPKIREYFCDFCDKVSLHRTTHLNHMRTHTGEKPYQCGLCDKAFRTTHARSSHMLLHTDERPHKCKVCEMAFRQTSHLKSHMLIHTGVKQHVCEYCQKAFTMKSNLMVHLRMHTGEMPYKCNKCPQKFLLLSQFKRHKMGHDEPHQNDAGRSNENDLAGDFNDSQISLYVDDIESS